MKKKPRVFIVDDHPIVRDFLRLLLEKQNFFCCGEAETVADALSGIEKTRPDVVILDISLEKGRNGLELIKDLRAMFPRLPALVFSMHDEAVFAERAFRAGASGYVSKTESSENIVEAIHKLVGGDVYMSPKTSGAMAKQLIAACSSTEKNPVDRLSDRELEVLEMIGRGRTNREIAGEVKLEAKTIETYRGRIKTKLGLKNSVELHQYAMQWVLDRNSRE